jgi:hypothetical protein
MPQHVVVFRDGVGDGQFNEVLDRELPCIQNALAGMVRFALSSCTRLFAHALSQLTGDSYNKNHNCGLPKETQHTIGL